MALNSPPRVGDVYRLPSGARVKVDGLLIGGNISCSYLHANTRRIDHARGELVLTLAFAEAHAQREVK